MLHAPIRPAADERADHGSVRHIALIGNAPPRRCGLATFTDDVNSALSSRFPGMCVDYYAMDDGSGIAYPDSIHTIRADDARAYREAAGMIEASGAQAIWLQHEYGIFGGSAGERILDLLHRTTKPLVVTLHTVLEKPDSEQRRVLEAIIDRAAHVIVMADRGRAILADVYGVDGAKVSVIPHGVPDRPFTDTGVMKAQLGLGDRPVILTFGLLAPDKGIHRMIEAMPAIVSRHPTALYVVLGATHPHIRRDHGETYRQSLVDLADRLGVAANVRFVDEFVETDALLDWLQAADVYVTPYLKRDQITSGTLSYAVGVGKPVVSTPYIHATEILADDHGHLVPMDAAPPLVDAVLTLLDDDDARLALARRAYRRGRTMLWPRLAERASSVLAAAIDTPAARTAITPLSDQLLPPDLSAVVRMTDDTGMFQHGIYAVPDRNHGYCIDDNARALILINRLADSNDAHGERLAITYAAFLQHGWNPDTRRFRNFMGFDRQWREAVGSDDSNGRTLWALGHTAAHGITQPLRDWALHLFDHSAGISSELTSPRTQAFAMLGAEAVLSLHRDHADAHDIAKTGGEMLMALVAAARRPDWAWFETVLAYDNARLPEALIRTGQRIGRDDFIACGLETLDWICAQQTAAHGHFRAVGSDSFGRPYAPPLPYDQQPLEAQASIDACDAAWAVTQDTRWLREAARAYHWFLGANDRNIPLVSRGDGGCHDGLMPHGLNRNQGAESILALQLASATISALPMHRIVVPNMPQAA